MANQCNVLGRSPIFSSIHSFIHSFSPSLVPFRRGSCVHRSYRREPIRGLGYVCCVAFLSLHSFETLCKLPQSPSTSLFPSSSPHARHLRLSDCPFLDRRDCSACPFLIARSSILCPILRCRLSVPSSMSMSPRWRCLSIRCLTVWRLAIRCLRVSVSMGGCGGCAVGRHMSLLHVAARPVVLVLGNDVPGVDHTGDPG